MLVMLSASRLKLGKVGTALAVFALGATVSLIGDACHVASGTTRYLWPNVPTIGKSAIWFPCAVGSAIWGLAVAGARAGLPGRARDRSDVVRGTAAVLALYALTAALRGQPSLVSVTLCGALALLIWAWWDACSASFAIAIAAAVLGPLGEISIAALGAASYAPDASQLFGVAPWLPCLYFAAGAVTSGIWRPMAEGKRG